MCGQFTWELVLNKFKGGRGDDFSGTPCITMTRKDMKKRQLQYSTVQYSSGASESVCTGAYSGSCCRFRCLSWFRFRYTDARIWSQPRQASNFLAWPASPGEALVSPSSLKYWAFFFTGPPYFMLLQDPIQTDQNQSAAVIRDFL